MATLTSVMSHQVVRGAVRTVGSGEARSAARLVVAAGSVTIGLLLLAPAASASTGGPGGDDAGAGLSFVQTLLLYVGAPAAIFVLIVLLVVGPSLGKGPRHRTGAALETGPIWVDPAGVQRTPADTVTPDGPGATRRRATEPGASDQGGASGRW